MAICGRSSLQEAEDTYAVKTFENWLLRLGWKEITDQTDQEPAIKQLAKMVQTRIGHDTMHLRQSPRYSSQSLAAGETGNQQIARRVRTWTSVLCEQYETEMSSAHRLFARVVMHVAWSMARLRVNTSKTTPFRIVRGHDFSGELLPFGECVQAK